MSVSIFNNEERLRAALLGDKEALGELMVKTPDEARKMYKNSVLIRETQDVRLLRLFYKLK